jgi:hypothetical protein
MTADERVADEPREIMTVQSKAPTRMYANKIPTGPALARAAPAPRNRPIPIPPPIPKALSNAVKTPATLLTNHGDVYTG